MTTPAFPLSQLGRPSVDYTLKLADLRVRTDTFSGLAQSYNASNAALTTISVKWEWGADNYAVFQDWFRDDCKDGSIEFTIADMYLFNALGTITARFTAPPKTTYKSWNHYSVSATLETRTADYITEATLDAALPTEPHTDNVTWPSDMFGNPSSDGYGEEAQSSSLRGKTSGYARPAMRRKSPVTVTQLPIKWEMSQANKILFDAWYHYKLVDGAAWFWIYTQFHGVWQYIKVRFIETISLKYEKTDWWEISGTVETIECNYYQEDHPFSEMDGTNHAMGLYARYVQRVDYTCTTNGFYIGYNDVIMSYKSGVFAWAIGVTITGSSGYSGYAYYYVGAYGASNCSLVLENSTIYLGSFYINAYNNNTVNSNNNTVVVKNSVVYHNLGETMIGCYSNTGTAEALTATLTLSDGTIWYNGYNWVVVGGHAGPDACYPKDCRFVVTGSGTAFLGDYGQTGTRDDQPLFLFTLANSTGNSVDLLNSALIKLGQSQNGTQYHKAINTEQINDSSDATQMAFRFGGGYLAYFGDCTDPDSEYTMHWSLKSETDDWQILPTGIVQVRDSDGTWRAGVSGDFTVTYCATDAEGLAATGGLYDGLAGYTVITGGASI